MTIGFLGGLANIFCSPPMHNLTGTGSYDLAEELQRPQAVLSQLRLAQESAMRLADRLNSAAGEGGGSAGATYDGASGTTTIAYTPVPGAYLEINGGRFVFDERGNIGIGSLALVDGNFTTSEFISILSAIRGSGGKLPGIGPAISAAGQGCFLAEGWVVSKKRYFAFSKTVSLKKKDILTSIPELFLQTVEIGYKGKKQSFNIDFLKTNCSISVQSHSSNDNQITLQYRIEVKSNSLLIKLPVEFYNERTVGLRHATF